jgi:phosphoglucosamine mutase
LTSHFGTDGIRGRAGSVLTTDLAHLAAFGFATRAPAKGAYSAKRPMAVLGRDSRQSSPMLAGAVASGLMVGGWDVLDLGIVPTPLVPFEILRRGFAGGVMITASHNPVHDNGVKFFSADGRKISEALEERIEQVIEAGQARVNAETWRFGALSEHDASEEYLRFAIRASGGTARPRGMRLVLDCAHGAACVLAPQAFERCGFGVQTICGSFDGARINVKCGATHLEALSRAVRRSKADFGLAFDGDADRVLAVDQEGRAVSGDKIIGLLATRIPRYKKQGGVVMTHMTNLGVEEALARRGVVMHRTDVGDAKVAATMSRLKLDLGGEQSGHVIMRDLLPSGDGILTGLRFACLVRASGKTLAELAGEFPEYPQLLTNLAVDDKSGWQGDKRLGKRLSEIRAQYRQARFYIRPSGTENLLRVLTESREKAICLAANEAACGALLEWDGRR